MNARSYFKLMLSFALAALVCFVIDNYTGAPETGIVEFVIFQISIWLFLDVRDGPHKVGN